ncbi:MAG: UDP-glucose 4-epimerase GalE [Bacteroidetes bacterium]|nr:UDP-glucose 4-epimerase GalE [Bacteroidota bacterium]
MTLRHILVTGGAGYIGSHTVVELLKAGYQVHIADNFSNSHPVCLDRIRQISGHSFGFSEMDLTDPVEVKKLFSMVPVEAVIHFAAFKAVGESVANPLMYFNNNLTGTLNLLTGMKEAGVKNLVFSSSATVYGNPSTVPITEDFPLSVTNPYGRTKLMAEDILRDLYASDPDWNIGLLRYFNPVGAHPSGLIGEDPSGIPNNLMPFVTQVAIGRRQELQVFGGDYPTRDGTGIRDYIHVVDLAIGHVKMVDKLSSSPGLVTYNLGTGEGYSVLEVIRAFEKASGKPVPYRIVSRRPGDVPACYANPEKARIELGWQAARSLDEMCADSWRWQEQNPNGFRE